MSILLLPLIFTIVAVVTDAQIEIDIVAPESSNVTIQTTGYTETTLNIDNKLLFHLSDELLKNALFKLTGEKPEVYIEDNGSNVYRNYKIQPVKTMLTPNEFKVMNVAREEVVLNKLQVFNHDDFLKSQLISLAGSVQDNVTCVYKQNNVFPVEVKHKIDAKRLGKSPSWIMKSNFGRDLSKIETNPITTSVTVHLLPKQDAAAILSATKVTVLIQIHYKVNLTGQVLAKFDNTNYVWGYEHYDIETIMEEAEMPNSVLLSEEITIEFYTNCAITVQGGVLATYSVNQCVFTAENKTQEIHWKGAKPKQDKIVAANFLPNLLKPLENSAKKYCATFLLFICVFLSL